FFQAEDGIRDRNVTGVQTCALPIFLGPAHGDPDVREVLPRDVDLELVGTAGPWEDGGAVDTLIGEFMRLPHMVHERWNGSAEQRVVPFRLFDELDLPHDGILAVVSV